MNADSQAPRHTLRSPGHVGDTNPFLSIWLEPRATIRKIVETNPHKHFYVLVSLFAFFSTLDRAVERNLATTCRSRR